MNNLFIFGVLFIVIAMVLGLLLAILLDQKIRAEGCAAHDLPLPDGAVDDRDRHRLEVDHEPRSGHRSHGPRLGF